MLYVIGGQKGGTGKTTIATNLAVALTLAGRETLLVDTDRQLTASHWCDLRQVHADLPPITCVQKHGNNIYRTLRDFAGRYHDVIVDAGGFDSVELRAALAAADCLYSPVRASQSDLWTLDAMTDLVTGARELNERLRAYLVLSMAPTNPAIQETREALSLLAEYPAFTVCTSILRDRKAWRDAMSQGRGVLELGDPKAAAEMNAFTRETSSHESIFQAVAQAC
jgi:chromosome partitioning protein